MREYERNVCPMNGRQPDVLVRVYMLGNVYVMIFWASLHGSRWS